MSRRVYSPFLVLVAITLAFTLAPTGIHAQTWTPTDLHNFTDTNDGAFPMDNLIQAHDGNYYGTARAVYKISPSGVFSVVNDAISPSGPVVEGPDGLLYGACGECGTSGNSAIFSMTTAGVAKILYTFTGGNDGSGPSPLILGTDGNYWGTTYAGGSGMIGTIFKITPAGVLTTVYAFPSDGSQGYDPTGIQLVQASDGNFYGAVTQTPPNEIILGQPTRPIPLVNRTRPHVEPTPSFTDGGIIFSISTGGGFAQSYAFGASDGNDPNVSLVEGQNGKLYGETAYGTAGYGNIFTLALGGGSGNFTTLYNFTGTTDAGTPEGGLFLATDGNFYGTASGAVANTGEGGTGAIFKLTPSGTFSVLNFKDSNNGNPDSSLLQGSDGTLYGTFDTLGSFAGECSDFGCGSVFQLTPSTKLAAPVQLSFSSSTTAPGTAVTLNWKVLNAFSDTLQLCYGYQSASGAGTTWPGKQKGTLSSSTHLYTGSAQITPTADGTYTYALTCGGQESASATLTVSGKGKDDSTTALTASPNPATIGQSVTLKATVTGSDSTPSGSVSYDVGTTVLTTASLNGSGVASFTASTNGEGAGVYPVTASYAGNSTYDSSTSSTVNVTLNKAPTSTALTASPSSVTPPADVTLTATVKRSTSGATGTPTGSVTFSVGSNVLATVKLSSGVAVLKASSAGQAAGSYPITAKYTGDAADTDSTSTAVTVTVK